MTPITINQNSLLLEEIGADDFDHAIIVKVENEKGELENQLFYFYKTDGYEYVKTLPDGEWKSLGLAKDLTEDQWRGILPQKEVRVWREHPILRTMYKANVMRYEDYENGDNYCFKLAMQAGFSLLKSHGYEPEITLILVK